MLLSKFTYFQTALLSLSSEYKIESVGFCETLQTFWQIILCHIPKDIQPDQKTLAFQIQLLAKLKNNSEVLFLTTVTLSLSLLPDR